MLAHLVSTGTQSATLVHPREVLGPALREGLPVGKPDAFAGGYATRQVVESAQLMDLRVHDHVIIGNGTGAWLSFVTRGLM